MKGLTLTELAAEVDRQSKSKKDYIAPASRIKFAESQDSSATMLRMHGKKDPFEIGDIFHAQIGEHLKIPRKYYQRMLEAAPVLLRRNVNHWLASDPRTRMIRTLDGRARAFLSDRYRIRDNFDMCEAILPLFAECKLEIVTANVTERNLYIKAVHPDLKGEIRGKKVGDVVQGGVEVGNSETGFGTSYSRQFMLRLSCTNGMTFSETGLKRHHLGGKLSMSGEKAQEILRDETREAEDKAFFMMMQDITRDCLTDKSFQALLGQCNDAAADDALSSRKGRALEDVVEVTRKSFGLTEGEGDSILKHLVEGGDLSRWGVANAVTRTAQDVETYDRFSDLQRVGGQIIELPRKKWAEIALLN